MSLTLVTGPANAGKAGRVLDAYRAALKRDPVLVVPTNPDVAHYQRELAGRGAVFGGSVVAFDGLIKEIATAAGYNGRRLSDIQRDRVLATALAGCSFTAIQSSASSAGFAAAARDLIDELQRSLIDPKRFTQALGDWASSGSDRTAYAQEVAKIYTSYRRELDRVGRVDEDLFARRALDALRQQPGRWGKRPVFFYGFDDFSGLQRDAIEALARVVDVEVVVALLFEDGRQAFASRAATVAELTPLADRVEKLKARDDHYGSASRLALDHLERNLFELDPQRVEPGDAVRVLEAGGERSELELVAAEILELLRGGMAPSEIAVVHRSPLLAAPLVAQVFDAYGVPYTLDRKLSLGHTTLGRGLCAALRCAAPEARATDVLTYLRTPGLLDKLALADRLEEELRTTGQDGVPEALDRWAEIAGWPLGEVKQLCVAATVGRLELLDCVINVARRLFDRPRKRRAWVDELDELEDARTLAAVIAAVAGLRELGAADPGTLPSPVELLEALHGLEVQCESVDSGVRVAGPLEIRARRFSAIFVCGLQDGGFPMSSRPEPFMPDEMRREVNVASGLRLEPKEDALDAERYLFYACVTRARERVALSWRSSDEEGNPALASFFLQDVVAVFDGDLLKSPARKRPLSQVTWPPDQAPTAIEVSRSLAARGPRSLPSPISTLLSPSVLECLSQTVFSPSALEAYIACPVRWLVERKLRPNLLAPDAEPLVRGTFFHRVLEKVLSKLRDQTGSARVTKASLGVAREIAVEAISECRLDLPLSPHEPTADIEVARLERDLMRYLESESKVSGGWEPAYLEWRFGFDDSEIGVLVLGDGEFSLRGSIDRIEISGDEAIVRDYKASATHPAARWEDDGIIQVGIYMLAVRELLGKAVVGGLYQPLGKDLRPRGLLLAEPTKALPLEGFVKTDLLDEAEFAEHLIDVEKRALEAVRLLRGGGLEALAKTCSSRGGCLYPGICRSGDLG